MVSRNVQKLRSRRPAVVITEDSAESLPASYSSLCAADHLIRHDDSLAQPLMIPFKMFSFLECESGIQGINSCGL